MGAGISIYEGIQHFRQPETNRHLSKDPTSFAILLEDGAALVGLGIAFVGVLAAQMLHEPRLDSVASIGIGCVLAATAVVMARESKGLLMGESAATEVEASVLALVASDPAVAHANGLITLHVVPRQVVAAISAAFDAKLTTAAIEACVLRLEKKIREKHAEATLLFIKPQTTNTFESSVIARELAHLSASFGARHRSSPACATRKTPSSR